jgi:hypothetical protein
MTVRLLADTLNIPKTVVHRIVMDELNMRKVCAKLVPKFREFLAKHHVATLPQPPYSPDLAPADFFLFKERRFESIPAIQAAVTTALNEVLVEALEGAYRAWEQTDLGCAVKLKASPPP